MKKAACKLLRLLNVLLVVPVLCIIPNFIDLVLCRRSR